MPSNRLFVRMYSLSPEVVWRAVAPGAALAIAGAAIAWGLARWYDRVPRRVLALFALLVVAFYGRVLLTGDVLLPLDNLRGDPPFEQVAAAEPHGNPLQGDLIHLIEPLRAEVRRSVAAGAWPLWAPRLGAGQPLLADPQAQAVQPLAAVGLVVALAADPLAAAGAVAGLRVFVALVFAFVLVRRLGAGIGPALAGALAYGLGGFLQLWLGWPLASSAAWLPAVLYALVRVAQHGGRRDLVLLAGGFFGLLTAGQPETIAYGLATAGALVASVVVPALLRGGGGEPAGGVARFVGRVAASAGLALLLAAPALLPFAAHAPETLRWSRLGTGGLEASVSPQVFAEPSAASRLIQAVAPHTFGSSRHGPYWGRRNSNEDAAGFVGTATLLAALLAAAAIAGRRGRPAVLAHEGAALCGTLLCATALALGGSGRLALLLDLFLALLASAALERFRRGEPPRWLVLGVLPGAAALLAALHVAAVPGFGHPHEPQTLDVLREGWRLWHLRFLAGTVLALLTAGWLLGESPGTTAARWRALRRGRYALRELAVLAIALAVAAELWLAHAPVNPPMPRTLALPTPPALATLGRAASPAGDAGPVRVAAADRVLLPNLGALYGFGDARVFDPMAPADYLALLEPAIEGWAGEIPLLAPESAAAPLRATLYDRLGVAWWLAPPAEPCPPGTEPVHEGVDARLCRRPGAEPLVRVEGGDGSPGGVERASASASGDRWTIELGEPRTTEETRLVTALYAAPGWHVLAHEDAETSAPAAVPVRPDGPLLAAGLPPATRRVDLLYRPAPFLAGCLLAGLGCGIAFAWLAVPRKR